MKYSFFGKMALLTLVSMAPFTAVFAEQSSGSIYRSTNANGEVTFSDEASAGAQRVEIEASVAAAPQDDRVQQQSADQVEAMLAVADSLEASRLQREAERDERRRKYQQEQRRLQEEELLAAQLEEQYYRSLNRTYPYWLPHGPRPYHPPQQYPPEQLPPDDPDEPQRPVFKSRLNRP